MIAQLSGNIIVKQADSIVLEVGGVGFAVNLSATSIAALPGNGEHATVLTYLQVSDDALTLYGFASEQERQLFGQLISVSKVGPRLALGVLSSYPTDTLLQIIAAGDAGMLSKAPGIGKKTAERIVLELQDKVGAQLSGGGVAVPAKSGAAAPGGEALQALLQMGFSSDEAALALKDYDGAAADTEAALKFALKNLGSH
jgi:Holliday junction DNA helicase RuvA